ncbi:hypothetical protein LXL04_013464 [Taraxacum kok-saghyz]
MPINQHVLSILSIVNDLCFYSASNVHFKIREAKYIERCFGETNQSEIAAFISYVLVMKSGVPNFCIVALALNDLRSMVVFVLWMWTEMVSNPNQITSGLDYLATRDDLGVFPWRSRVRVPLRAFPQEKVEKKKRRPQVGVKGASNMEKVEIRHWTILDGGRPVIEIRLGHLQLKLTGRQLYSPQKTTPQSTRLSNSSLPPETPPTTMNPHSFHPFTFPETQSMNPPP